MLATVEYVPAAVLRTKPFAAKADKPCNSALTPTFTVDVDPPPVIPVPTAIVEIEPGTNPNNVVISAEVAFDNTPAPLDLTSVFPFTPDNVIPVNVGEFPVPNPKFVLDVAAFATSDKLFAGFNGVNPNALCLLLKVVQSVDVSAPVKAVVAFCKLMTPAATCKFVPT